MNWQAISFDWSHIRAFVATAELGTLSAASRALGLTQPTLGRQVTALEDSLGVTLFERAGRRMALTSQGRSLLPVAQEMRDTALRFSLVAEGQTRSVSGHVSITATDFVCAHALPPIIAALRQRAPGLDIDLLPSNEVQDLTRRAADISIRHARPVQPELIGRLLGEKPAYLCAAPQYLDRVGRPKSLADLETADFVGFEDTQVMVEILNGVGVPVRAENVHVSSPAGAVIGALTQQGLGYSIQTDDIIRQLPGVEIVLPDVFHIPIPVWLVTHRELHSSARIRFVFDHLAENLVSGYLRA